MERGAKIFSLFIVLYMMLSLFAACNEDKNSQKKSSEEPLEQAKLLILTGADQTEQPDAQIVWDEIAKVTADNINIKIEVQSYAWGDYVQKVNTMAAAGQVFDIYLNFQDSLAEMFPRSSA